eukprot:jgi/Bigna1/82954/fgenesh1_pg.99_\
MERLKRISRHIAASNVSEEGKRKARVNATGAVIVDGARTPFVKSFGAIMKNNAISLGAAAVKGLVAKTKIDPNAIDQLIMGNVVVNSNAPNLAREIIIDLMLPSNVEANPMDKTRKGDPGHNSLHRMFIGLYAGLSELFKIAGPVSGWLPKAPAIAERSTEFGEKLIHPLQLIVNCTENGGGRTMGYHADLMAEINAINRKDQDAFAIGSHSKASKARAAIRSEVVPVKNAEGKIVNDDNLIRSKINPAKVAKLKPAFRKPQDHGTGGSSSGLKDGASAVLLLRERVLATLKVLESKEFARAFLGRDTPVGSVPLEKVNLNGGSIAIGHPFAATGGRLVTTAANLLRKTGKRYALLSICAAGG